ncbi:DUF115 domain-containing protein [Shewanella sp. ULN5]|uniref:6-hydroxymethylpterin diphosphokinase MptE-like protein n=1 Tax=Shewanella sp. ULN5 TaxID=2994678 RepID=UPI00273EA83F|nr:6-hydroxymethylpterin diphosphokinase MptE-like protein [Shewanella sp. ULN5]MDP5144989.1 DUF115 domain-containing protein [Shewanella sp. ULN5]
MLNIPSEIAKTFAISQFNEGYLPSVNRHTFEKIDSVTLYNERFKGELSTADTLHVIIGLDSGLLANYIMEHPLAKGSKYIFVELPEILELLTINIPTTLRGELIITSLDEFTKFIKISENNLYIAKKKFKVHRSIAVAGNYLESYCTLNARVVKELEQEYFQQSTGFTQKIFIKTQLQNLSENQLPAKLLKQAFIGKSCIVLGGGPSLDGKIDWIKANSERLVIIAASRVAGKLSKLNIKADIIVSVDPQSVSFDVNKDLMQLEHSSLLINSYHVTPQILGQWRGASLYTGSRFPWENELDQDNIKSAGPTVTNAAIEIATEMGFKQVLLCGVDFCHSQTGATHTIGTYGASLSTSLGNMLEWVETYSGNMAETPIQLLHAIESLQEAAVINLNTTYINLSNDAAKVNGVQYQASQDIFLEKITNEQRQILCPKNYQIPAREKISYLNDILDNLTTTQDKLQKLQLLLSDALMLISKMTKNQKETKRAAVFSEKLDKLEQKINCKFAPLAYLIKLYGLYEFSQFLSTKKEDEWARQDVDKQMLIYYKAFEIIANEISELITSAIKRVRSRINEFDSPCDINALYAQWDNDKQWGRAISWKLNHPEQYKLLNEEEVRLLQKAEGQYYTQFVVKQHIDDTVKTTVPSMDNAFKKLEFLRQSNHLIGISKMVQYTLPFIDSDPEVSRLYHLALSYQQMLENQPELALDTMLTSPIKHSHEAEFKHIIKLALELNQLQLATCYYSKIIQFSDQYLPQYANALRLGNNPQEALNIYLDYLDKYPEDISILLKFGIFLAEFGKIDEAKSCFQNVLALEPRNQPATIYLEKINRGR